MAQIKLSASILPLKDLSQEEIAAQSIFALKGGASSIHIDYAPPLARGENILERGSDETNTAFTTNFVRFLKSFALRDGLKAELNVHLMCSEPSTEFLRDWASSGADTILPTLKLLKAERVCLRQLT